MPRAIVIALVLATAACDLFGPGEEDVVVDVRSVRGSWPGDPLAVLYHSETHEEYDVKPLGSAGGLFDPDLSKVTLRATVASEVCPALRVRIVPLSELDLGLGRCGEFSIQLDWTDTTATMRTGRGL